MSQTKKACALLVAACVLFSGCYVRLGYKTTLLRTEEERRPISSQGPIDGKVQEAPGGFAVLQLTRTQTEEVLTVELFQRVQRRFDLTGLAIAAGGVGFLLFILTIIAIANSDGSSGGSSSSWDWD